LNSLELAFCPNALCLWTTYTWFCSLHVGFRSGWAKDRDEKKERKLKAFKLNHLQLRASLAQAMPDSNVKEAQPLFYYENNTEYFFKRLDGQRH